MSNKRIGLFTSTALVMGNMIASGLFMLPASLAVFGGISLIGWLVSGTGAMCLALVFGWLSRRFPSATGGPYAYTREGLGPFAAFLVAWGYWISCWSTNAAITVAFVSYLSAFIPALSTTPLLAVAAGLAAIWLLTWINARGIRQAGVVQVITTVLKIIPLLIVTIAGFIYFNGNHFIPFNISSQPSWLAVAQATTLTLFAFLGLESATVPAGHVRNPHHTIPRATIIGTGLTTVLYTVSTIAVMGLIPPAGLHASAAPFADAAALVFGDMGRYLVAAGAVISTFGALNGWILIQAQMPFAAARDRLFPAFFARTNTRDVPVAGLVFGSLLVSVMMGMNFSRSLADTYTFIILLSTLNTLFAFLLSVTSFLVKSKGIKVSSWKITVALLAWGYAMWAVVGSGREAVYWGFILLMAGLPFYAWVQTPECLSGSDKKSSRL
ncbi:MAG: amino acid permease [Cyclobacteriaceae bacterium]|nr:MAG: amino acid permease [Cyclobacteriaceae bacterium]